MSLTGCANCLKPLGIGLGEDWYACSTCTRKLCAKCGEIDKPCALCNEGKLLFNTIVEPKGDYRLPVYLRLPTIEEKLKKLEEVYEEGCMSPREKENLKEAILDPTVILNYF